MGSVWSVVLIAIAPLFAADQSEIIRLCAIGTCNHSGSATPNEGRFRPGRGAQAFSSYLCP
jgi:hypothetical protein